MLHRAKRNKEDQSECFVGREKRKKEKSPLGRTTIDLFVFQIPAFRSASRNITKQKRALCSQTGRCGCTIHSWYTQEGRGSPARMEEREEKPLYTSGDEGLPVVRGSPKICYACICLSLSIDVYTYIGIHRASQKMYLYLSLCTRVYVCACVSEGRTLLYLSINTRNIMSEGEKVSLCTRRQPQKETVFSVCISLFC